MRIYEFFGLARSGHHAVINWVIKNLTGVESEMKWKLDLTNGKGLTYINEANHDVEYTLKYIKDQQAYTRALVLSYENCENDFTILNVEHQKYDSFLSLNLEEIKNFQEHKRIIIIRDFYNILASRIKANNENIVKSREGLVLNWDVESRFINLWKEQAKYILEGKSLYIKFEDWYTNKKIRNQFISNLIGRNEFYDSKVLGTISSFGENEGVLDRFSNVELPENIKKLIKEDNELHYLIGKMGYEYRQI